MRPLATLCVAAGLTCSATAWGQPSEKPVAGGFVLHSKIGLPMGPNAIACGAERAFVRTWGGRVVMFDGQVWSKLPDVPGHQNSRGYGTGVAVAPDGGAFVEASGRIARWDGKSWSLLELPGWQGPIAAMTVLGSGELVVVGHGRVGLVTGAAITSYDAGTWRDLRAVAGTSLVDLWTAGQGGTVMRHDAKGWSRMDTGATSWFQGLDLCGPRCAWAWGGRYHRRGGESPVVVRYDGKSWAKADQSLPGPIIGVAATAKETWSAGGSFIARFDGGAWSKQLDAADLGSDYHDFIGICANSRFVVVGDGGGHALVRPAAK